MDENDLGMDLEVTASHYIVGTARYERVTHVIGRHMPFTGVAKTPEIAAQWEKSRLDGVEMHRQIQCWFEGKPGLMGEGPERIQFERYIARKKDWVVVACENKLFCSEYHIAGTFDLLVYDVHRKKMILVDWKRIKHVYAEKRRRQILQLNMYRVILEISYGIIVDEMLVVCIHPDNETVKEMDIPAVDVVLELGLVQ